MRCSKSCYLRDLELVNLFNTSLSNKSNSLRLTTYSVTTSSKSSFPASANGFPLFPRHHINCFLILSIHPYFAQKRVMPVSVSNTYWRYSRAYGTPCVSTAICRLLPETFCLHRAIVSCAGGIFNALLID